MIQAFFRGHWYEVVYVESGKIGSSDDKTLKDHKKLICLCEAGHYEIAKKTFKKTLNEFFIEFGINLSGNIRLIVTF